MITIISSTNRAKSNTYIIAKHYENLFNNLGIETSFFDLAGHDFSSLLTHSFQENKFVQNLEATYFENERIIIVAPEYNGTFPGILKLFIDNCNVKKTWFNKKIALTGVANGRAGNLRGLDHLAAALMYMQNNVYHNKLPISGVSSLITNGVLTDEPTIAAIEKQLTAFLNW